MIIYIADEENRGMLDVPAKEHEWELLAVSMDGQYLTDFLTDKLQVITNLRYLVIDRSALKETAAELEEVIEQVQVMWNTQVILLEEELTDGEGEQKNVIYGEKAIFLYKYQDRLTSCLEYLLQGEKIPAEEVYDGIWIGVMSANSGAGATHTAVGLANYIAGQDKTVCYVEANESGDLAAMASFYGMEKIEDEHYRKDGVDYWRQSVDPEKRFAVLDLGKYSGTKLTLFNQCKVKIVITDGKPYRMADALTVFRYVGDKDARLWLNFTDEEDYGRVCREYLKNTEKTGRLAWNGDMFGGTDELYQEALGEYLTPVQRSRMSFIVRAIRKHPHKAGKAEIHKAAAEKLYPEEIPEEKEGNIPDVPAEEEELLQVEVKEDLAMDDWETEEETEPVDTEEQSFCPEKKTERKKADKVLLSVLVLFALAAGALSALQGVRSFLFPNPGEAEQGKELVDEELNINPEIRISVLEVEGADGYEVSYSTDESFDQKTTVVVEVEAAAKAVENLDAGKTYYVRVRAFKFNEEGIKVYGEYTNVQKIET
ncbi:MAG: fibronectin type III domain-containing protein [Bacteroidales bacterium]|nr:fibronectin type III domain-containing protein [Clostridium sp.]MCM1204951.1 fibronectin type III domain-containing protein [Bacteroidales bacterium]